jgi:hypothetical protein
VALGPWRCGGPQTLASREFLFHVMLFSMSSSGCEPAAPS